MPISPSSTTFSESSLLPRALNFSRPRPLFSPDPTLETCASHQRQDSIASDSAAPPPIVRTYASSVDLEDLHQIDFRDSIDEALPPPIRTHSNWKDSSYTPYPVATPSTPAAIHRSGAPREWIYKPYVNSVTSVASSVATDTSDETQDTAESDDTTRTDYLLETNYTINNDTHDAQNASMADGTATPRSSTSSFAFDGRLGWNPKPQLATAEAERQRWAPQKPVNTTEIKSQVEASREDSTASSAQALFPTTTRLSTASSSTTTSSSNASSGTSAPPIPVRMPRIVKRTDVDQISEHVNLSQGESMSDRGSISSNEWTSSEHDTSGLSIEKIHKLKKKGINPALYAEMQNARKGKSKWISPLQGNSFLM